MAAEIKVEFEVKAFGGETIEGYEDSFKGFEIARTKSLSKDTTLGEIEVIVKELFDEIQGSYGKKPDALSAKIVIRANKKDTHITYL